jgi:ABC-type nitrate/sulfonate/bicarbonate transport system ATPase subunit
MLAWRVPYFEMSVERIIEEIESQLVTDGVTSIMMVHNALTGWSLETRMWSRTSPAWLGEVGCGKPTLIRLIRGVFRALDRHQLITCAKYDKTKKRCLLWRDATDLS